MWNLSPLSIRTTPESQPQKFAGEDFFFATIEEFQIAIDIPITGAWERRTKP